MIPDRVLEQVYAHAREAFPAECCGYLRGDDLEVVRCTNADPHAERFAIDGKDLLAFAKSFDSDRPARVIYHSHTNGRAYFSQTDRAQAGGYPVMHLVVGVTAQGATEAALFRAEDFEEIARYKVLG